MLFFLITFVLSACGQNVSKSDKNPQEEINYQARRDSVLLQTEYGSIYFTRDLTARGYGYLNPEEIDSSVFQTIMPEIIQSIQESQKTPVKHFNHQLINSSWSSLYWFNNDFCLYSPSDWMSNKPMLITDSIIYELASDPGLEIIKSVQEINNHKIEFTSQEYSGEVKTTSIEIIDPQRGIAIWEYKYGNNDSVVRELRVRSEYVRLFPMIICDCGDNKCVFGGENFFSEPDYSALKSTRKR